MAYENRSRGGYSNNRDTKVDYSQYLKEQDFFKNSKTWVKEGANQDLINFTEKVGSKLENLKLTTSQFRNVYGELKRIQMSGFNTHKSDFFLLQPKVAYAYARATKDRKGDGMDLFKNIFDELCQHVQNEKDYGNFVAIFEALIAYHKAAGGK